MHKENVNPYRVHNEFTEFIKEKGAYLVPFFLTRFKKVLKKGICPTISHIVPYNPKKAYEGSVS